MNETTSTVAPVEPKATIGQKVNELQAEKTRLTSEMNEMPEGAPKVAAQDRIAIIDRKLRWYAGRSEGTKQVAVKAARPSKAAKEPKAAKVAKSAPVAAQPVASAANES